MGNIADRRTLVNAGTGGLSVLRVRNCVFVVEIRAQKSSSN
jgi:hypothetical protein